MIHCDHNASSPLRPEVLEAMLSWLQGPGGNASSVHRLGSRARCAVEEARGEVATLLGASPAEIVFTSGGTESNNLAIEGCARRLERRDGVNRTVATTAIEHASVLEPVSALVERGWQVRYLLLDSAGRVVVDSMEEGIASAPLVVIGLANNEIGTTQPLEEISALCRARGAVLHADATQAVGKIPVSSRLADLMTVSAHKMGGPQGVGALFVRHDVALDPLLRGGGQERERRAGTENVAGIIGFGVAARLAAAELDRFAASCRAWRDTLWAAIAGSIPACRRVSPGGPQDLPNTLNVCFEGVRGEALVAALDLAGVAVSSGSACAAGAGEPSHVLLALGVNSDEARNGIRFSCGRGNRMDEVDSIADRLRAAVERIRTARP